MIIVFQWPYVAIYSVGEVNSPLIINPLTNLVKMLGLDVFSASGILALFIGIICLMTRFKKNIVRNN